MSGQDKPLSYADLHPDLCGRLTLHDQAEPCDGYVRWIPRCEDGPGGLFGINRDDVPTRLRADCPMDPEALQEYLLTPFEARVIDAMRGKREETKR